MLRTKSAEFYVCPILTLPVLIGGDKYDREYCQMDCVAFCHDKETNTWQCTALKSPLRELIDGRPDDLAYGPQE